LSVGSEHCSESHRQDAKGAKKTIKNWAIFAFAVKKFLISPNNTQRGDHPIFF